MQVLQVSVFASPSDSHIIYIYIHIYFYNGHIVIGGCHICEACECEFLKAFVILNSTKPSHLSICGALGLNLNASPFEVMSWRDRRIVARCQTDAAFEPE